MSRAGFDFIRVTGTTKKPTGSVLEAITGRADGDAASERWLFVSPHDDDACIGGGLWMQAALRAGIDCELLIVTDGRLGYCSDDQWLKIVQIRRAETYEAFALLGLDKQHVHYIDYPDGGLANLQGRRAAQPGEAHIQHYVGLQNAFTHYLRRFRPTRVLVPTPTDLHPDHQITYNELMISLFHAGGKIWPELGEPIADVPAVYEMAVYCDFAQEPNLGVRGTGEAFEKKLASIAAFKSQAQIAALVESVKQAGPFEFLREVVFRFYSANTYKPMFED